MKLAIQLSCQFALLFGSAAVHAQQVPRFTHYMNNTLVVNPAYAGSRDALTVTALHRSQWVGFKDAPVTQTLTLHAPIINQHLGLGFAVLNDKIGPTNATSVNASIAYRMTLTPKARLALGLSGGINVLQANLTSVDLDVAGDAAFQNDVNNAITPSVGFGAYYSRDRFYAGFSTPDLLQNTYSITKQSNSSTLVGKEKRHYFLIAGSMIKLSNTLDFKPTTLVKLTPGAPIQADLTASFIISKKILLGAMYRTGDAVGALLGINFTEQLYLGYSYDWSYGLKTGTYNNGSHELMLRYDFIFTDGRQIHSPRYF